MASEGEAIVKIDADGGVISCAKGASPAECGYKAGSKVCGACGAVAMEVKMGYGDAMESDEAVPMMPKKKKKKPMMAEEKAAVRAYGDVIDDEEELEEDEEEEMEGDLESADETEPDMEGESDEEMMDDEEMDEESVENRVGAAEEAMDEESEDEELAEAIATGKPPMRKRRQMAQMSLEPRSSNRAPSMPVDEEIERVMADEEDMRDEEMLAERPNRQMMRNRRLSSMGYKTGEFGEAPFVCSIERKVYPGNAQVCDNCPGGCVAEGDMPALLEVEGIAEDMFSGKVLDSGYSDSADIFVVDVERKDGKPIEAFFDGTTGECMGWHLLNEEILQVKSAFQAPQLISFSEAAEIATKSVAGDVVSVEADIFEGYDSYAVEIEGVDGKSYDVFVSLDGEVLGYDTYTQEEALAIEAEAAEIALKRAHDETERKEMAASGEAMDDGEMPIRNASDLRNAIMAWPRSANRDAAKLHIMKRAAALGLEASLPAEWVAQELMGQKEDANFMSSLLEFEMLETEASDNDPERLAELYFKRMFSDERREDLAKRGMALPDGSYPIENEEDLKNAIQAYGRAKDKEAAKAHIMKRARALGKEDLIPQNWQ